MDKRIKLILCTDCGGSDCGRYEIAVQRCFDPHQPQITFFATTSMNTLHAGFTTAAHALSSVDRFGPLREGEYIGILDNAAPRHGTENGARLRGEVRNPSGEEIYALELDNGVWVVGPNAGMNFHFIKERIKESFLVSDSLCGETPFRSMEVMIPAFAKLFNVRDYPNITLTPKVLFVPTPEPGVFVADFDDHGNIYLVSTEEGDAWVPPLEGHRVVKIGEKIARVRHVKGIFAGQTGEQTLTRGSLTLNGRPVYYIVIVGASAHAIFGNPPVGTRVEFENN